MARLPFDPEKMKGPAPLKGPARAPGVPRDAITVSELASRIDHALRTRFAERVHVVGEISGFNDRTHWYFSLKDEGALVSCVMFASAARRVGTAPQNGQAVVATGRIEFYEKQGRTQLYVEKLVPIGTGDLEARFRALFEELKTLGWFDAHRKRALPPFPRRVAVVTSRTGAALQDVVDTARRRCPAVQLALVDVKVQGAAAATDVVRALRWLSARHETLGIDAIILTRGGGSIEDLWTFNERDVARALLECAVPVVAAIGHESDTTIAELVADERAATPTQAAMRLTPDRASLHEQLDQLAARLRASLGRQLRHDRARIDGIARRALFADPRTVVAIAARALAATERRLAQASRHALGHARLRLERAGSRLARNRPEALHSARRVRVDRIRHRLEHAMRARLRTFDAPAATRNLSRAFGRSLRTRVDRLDALERELIVVGPQHVLARGYSVTTGEGGRVIRSVRQVGAGQALETRVADGSFRSRVEDAEPAAASPGKPAPAPLPPRRRSARRADARKRDPDQLGLF